MIHPKMREKSKMGIWYPPENNIRYLNSSIYGVSILVIPKTAMTSLMTVFQARDVTRKPQYRSIAVFRDPVSRVASGWGECVKMRLTRTTTFEDFLEEVNKKGFYDEHIWPADWFYQDVDKIYDFNKLSEIEKDFDVRIPVMNVGTKPEAKANEIFNMLYSKEINLYGKLCI